MCRALSCPAKRSQPLRGAAGPAWQHMLSITSNHTPASGTHVHLVGGAHVAAELDAKRAIDHAMRLAAVIETIQPGKAFDYQPATTLASKIIDYVGQRGQ
jgi:hypothetical protein